MTMRTEGDALACLAVLVAGMDGVGTMEERDFLFSVLAGLPPFETLDRSQFATLLSDASRRVHEVPRDEHGGPTDRGISELLDQICAQLSPDLRAQAFNMAMGLARSDEMVAAEERLMDQLRVRLLA